MMEDDEGFVYPAFDAEKCCGCEACLRACPYGNELPREGAPIAVFGGHHKNASILEDSTSGGAFSALVEAWFLREGNRAVWGAASHGIDVRHECALNFEESVRFRKSKYCQSDMGSAYADIRLQLKAGTFVLFSGTPCQVAGLRSFLGPRAYGGRLLTVEVVCEGVPTPLYLRKYIERLESGHGSKLAELDYRYKDGRRWDFQVMLATFEDGQYCKVDRWFNPFWSIWLAPHESAELLLLPFCSARSHSRCHAWGSLGRAPLLPRSLLKKCRCLSRCVQHRSRCVPAERRSVVS